MTNGLKFGPISGVPFGGLKNCVQLSALPRQKHSKIGRAAPTNFWKRLRVLGMNRAISPDRAPRWQLLTRARSRDAETKSPEGMAERLLRCRIAQHPAIYRRAVSAWSWFCAGAFYRGIGLERRSAKYPHS